MRDDQLPDSVGFFYWRRNLPIRRQVRVECVMSGNKISTGMRTLRWRTGCALALGCFFLSGHAFAQSSNSSGDSTTHAATSKKATSAKKKSSPAKAKPAKSRSSRPAAAASTSASSSRKKSASAALHKVGKSAKGRRTTAKARGQQNIDPERAQQIQEALIREHYLNGEAPGTWDASSEAAMRRYQADHGWQSKTVPDARALISLGLGPSKEHLLNPESAMTTGPEAPRAAALAPTSHSADPGGPMNPSQSATPLSSPSDHDSSSQQ